MILKIGIVNETLKSLGAADKRRLLVFNKLDRYRDRNFDDLLDEEVKDDILVELKRKLENQYHDRVIFISAKKKENIQEFRDLLRNEIEAEYEIRYPYQVKNF